MVDVSGMYRYEIPGGTHEQQVAYSEIRGAARRLAEVIAEETPDGSDGQLAALRLLSQAVEAANAAVAQRKE